MKAIELFLNLISLLKLFSWLNNLYFGSNTWCDICLQFQSHFNVRDTMLSVIVQIIINLLTKERGSLACVLQNTLHWILLKGYHVSDHQHIPKRGQLFSYLGWGNGEICILFDLIYICYLPGISYYSKGVGI
jgi:hypothetical protein